MGGKRYTESLKERAFRIFYDTGSLSEVVRVLKKEFKGISKSTVSKWSKEEDSRGKNWEERRSAIQAANHEHVDEQIASDRKEILKGASQVKERLLSQIPNAEVKSAEGAAFAYTAISKFILEQSGADRNSEQTAKESVSALILALKDDPDLSTLLDQKWPEIEERFFKHLERIQKQEKKKK